MLELKRLTIDSHDINANVMTTFLPEEATLPLVIKPIVPELDLIAWAASQQDWLQKQILKYGAILFQGWQLSTIQQLEQVVQSVSGQAMEYRERSSPRSSVGDNIYTSTNHPAAWSIFPHNEHSYSKTFPLKLYFYCSIPATTGGETLLVDARKVRDRISQKTQDKFREKGWMYVRNFGNGIGLPWQTVFMTDDKREVEDHCERAAIEYEWMDDDRLRTRQVRPVFASHPLTNESLWFNHATFFHISTMEDPIRSSLITQFAEEDLPNNTYYGDGSRIEPEVIIELKAAYTAEMVPLKWQMADLIILDNMLTAHARAPYSGPRAIWFAMAEPVTRNDL
jgi:alpha-ketoglutarate-dependent taurine dioxygenase